MAKVYLENSKLVLVLDTKGAELHSVVGVRESRDQLERREYLWGGDPKFWGRHAPVLFPFVGTQKDKEIKHEGKRYPMTQHGFARDKEFIIVSQEEHKVWFQLNSDDDTKKCYPFDFVLFIGYELLENTIKVSYRVENPSDETIYFAIGAHPAFYCPIKEGTGQEEYSFRFPKLSTLTYYGIQLESGLKEDRKYQKSLITEGDYGYLPIEPGLFDGDALIMEQSGVQEIALCSPEKTPYVIVRFDAPLFGLWSPAGKCAPFVCIEPWYGRCDGVGFDGEIKDKEYINTLEKGKRFEKSYTMQFLGE